MVLKLEALLDLGFLGHMKEAVIFEIHRRMMVDRLQLQVGADHSNSLLHSFVSLTEYHQSFVVFVHYYHHHWPTYHRKLKYPVHRCKCMQLTDIQQKPSSSNIKLKLVWILPQNFFSYFLGQ